MRQQPPVEWKKKGTIVHIFGGLESNDIELGLWQFLDKYNQEQNHVHWYDREIIFGNLIVDECSNLKYQEYDARS